MNSKENKRKLFQKIILSGFLLSSMMMIVGGSAFVANKDSYFSKFDFLSYLGMGSFIAFLPLYIVTAIFAFKTKAFSNRLTIFLMIFIPVIVVFISGIVNSTL